MYTNLNVFRLAYAMASHAGRRQAVIASNVANSDTPGYQARDIAPFADVVSGDAAFGMRATRPTHFSGQADGGLSWPEFTSPDDADPNGNSVSVEKEMVKAADARREHDQALAIYKSALNILRTSLGRG